MQIPAGLNQAQTRQYLQGQWRTGRYMILGTVIITVIDLLFFLLNTEMYISYSLAGAYYAAVLGWIMDGYTLGGRAGAGLVVAGILLAALLVLWLLSKNRLFWFRAAMGVLAADTVLLVVLGLRVFDGGVISVVWELVIHVAVLYEMARGLSAWHMLQTMPETDLL